MFVGYPQNHAGDCYEMWDKNTRQLHTTRNIIWLNQMYFDEPNLIDAINASKRRETKDCKVYVQIISPTGRIIEQEPMIKSTVVIKELENNEDKKLEEEVNNVTAGESQDKEQKADHNDEEDNQENKKTNIKPHVIIKLGESKESGRYDEWEGLSPRRKIMERGEHMNKPIKSNNKNKENESIGENDKNNEMKIKMKIRRGMKWI